MKLSGASPLLLLALAACGPEPAAGPGPVPAPAVEGSTFAPPPATLHRLTDAAWRNSARDLLGVGFSGELPVDYRLHGYTTVGATEVSISPFDLELYETAAWTLARAAVPDDAARDARVGCTLDPAPGLTDAELEAWRPEACVAGWLGSYLLQAWRRPPTLDEIEGMVDLYVQVDDQLHRPTLALRAVIAASLLSPHFLFRVEQGETDPDNPLRRRFTNYEMASRISYAIVGSSPDAALLQAAEAGLLVTDAGIAAQAGRLLDDRASVGHLSAFFAETWDLGRVTYAEKSPDLYPWDSPALRDAMQEEVTALFAQLALVEDRELGALFTTRRTWLSHSDLAALYGLELDSSALPTWAELPAGQARGGLTGRAAFLMVNAHNSQTSPTRRGKALRTRFFCGDVPPPPDGVVASLEEGDAAEGSLRDRLEQHATDPACSACHDLMDPLGYPLEHFGPMGEWRATDNGWPIDATGDVLGVAVDGAESLGAALASHPDVGPCFARQLFRFGTGHLEGPWQEPAVVDLGEGFVADGSRVKALVVALVLSEGFRSVAAPAELSCSEDQEGETRACSNNCGSGEERCQDGAWVGCSAIAPEAESCNGEDDDCDGEVDEDVVQACTADGAPGLSRCRGGGFGACEIGPPPDERCNGEDDDGDGRIDEDLAVGLEVVSFARLRSDGHGDCDAALNPDSPACRAATHRLCGGLGCYVTGIGVVATDDIGERATLACLHESEAVLVDSRFSTLATYHDGCSTSSRQGGPCNAAMNRMCASMGLGTGFGPVENSGDNALVVCTTGAISLSTTYTALSALQPACDGNTARMGGLCNTAFHQLCRTQGAATGHGPLENSGDVAYAGCLGQLESADSGSGE